MAFSYQPETGVLSGTSFESQSEAFLQRAAVGGLPGSTAQTLSTSGATSSTVLDGVTVFTKTFTAPSAGYYNVICDKVCKIENLSNGMVDIGLNDGDTAAMMPVSAGQSVSITWRTDRLKLIFCKSVEA